MIGIESISREGKLSSPMHTASRKGSAGGFLIFMDARNIRNASDWKKDDHRPPKGGWAEGGYMCLCVKCGYYFAGDKRAAECADCAYGTTARQPEA